MKRAAAFSGIQICAYAAMDNHFHVVCKVVRSDVRLSEDALLGRMAMLKGAKAAAKLAEWWKGMREAGMDCAVAGEQDSLRKRMDDISEFMKTFKEIFNIWYKRERKYTGTIWSGRFKSTLIEGGRYRETCMRYVYLNPVRAGPIKSAGVCPQSLRGVCPQSPPSRTSGKDSASLRRKVYRVPFDPPAKGSPDSVSSSCSCVFPFRGFCHGAHDAVVPNEWQYGAMTKRADGQPAEKASRRKEFCIANYHVSLDAEKRL